MTQTTLKVFLQINLQTNFNNKQHGNNSRIIHSFTITRY